jgi:hypothetical protein
MYVHCMKLSKKDKLITGVHYYCATRPKIVFVQVSFLSYLLIPCMVAEFQQDRLDQMHKTSSNFPTKKHTKIRKQNEAGLGSAEGKQDYIARDIASMIACFASWYALRAS